MTVMTENNKCVYYMNTLQKLNYFIRVGNVMIENNVPIRRDKMILLVFLRVAALNIF